jgi:hypothetical protein
MTDFVTSLPDREAWIAGQRAILAMLAADADIPLPHGANAPVKFFASAKVAQRIADRLDDAHTTDRPGFIFDHSVTGTIAGAAVQIFTGRSTGVKA